MKTAGEILKLSIEYLSSKNMDRARRISEDLLAHALNLTRMELYVQYDRPVEEKELSMFREQLKRSLKEEPVQYILGEVEFYNCLIAVDPRALIPRPETQLLVDMIVPSVQKETLWDLCTGSGCIGIALKKANPKLNVILSDISAEALSLARENAVRNEVEVQCVQGDLFEPFRGGKADVIVCNPPYIAASEYSKLEPSVRNFEPKLALVAGEKGIEFYERIQRDIDAYLNPKGTLYLEIGESQGKQLFALFPSGELLNDWAGRPRFFIYRRQ